MHVYVVSNDERCNYLRMDENVACTVAVTKARRVKAYFCRLQKLWKSELSVFNKNISHNAISIPVLVPIYGITNWTFYEICSLPVLL